MRTSAPALTARLNSASLSLTYSHNEAGEQQVRRVQLHAPVERLAVHHVDQHQADRRAGGEAGGRAGEREQPALGGEHGADLRAR